MKHDNQIGKRMTRSALFIGIIMVLSGCVVVVDRTPPAPPVEIEGASYYFQDYDPTSGSGSQEYCYGEETNCDIDSCRKTRKMECVWEKVGTQLRLTPKRQ